MTLNTFVFLTKVFLMAISFSFVFPIWIAFILLGINGILTPLSLRIINVCDEWLILENILVYVYTFFFSSHSLAASVQSSATCPGFKHSKHIVKDFTISILSWNFTPFILFSALFASFLLPRLSLLFLWLSCEPFQALFLSS